MGDNKELIGDNNDTVIWRGYRRYIDGCGDHECLSIATVPFFGNNRNLTFTVHFRDFQRLISFIFHS